jgi:predicted N-acyltransferase
MHARFLTSINEVAAADWDRLFAGGNPFTRHAFLAALEDSGSVCDETGWQPLHLLLEDGGALIAAMPVYLKSHSYGEFVFDWAWAEAYRRNGFDYYPKLLTAIPFSPVAGPRIGLAAGVDPTTAVTAAFAAVCKLASDVQASGWHLLFPDEAHQDLLTDAGLADALLRREDVQFHWRNAGYAHFDEFLATLRSSRRKNVRRERRRIREQGIEMRRLCGDAITAPDWDAFYRCYRETYRKRSGHDGYLNRAFFDALLRSQREQLLLVTASGDEGVVGSALFLFDDRRLFGRYWGALETIDCLHFEACFYQGIEFCIERGLAVFDPGTQGEHKLMRGFEPVRTTSCHWLADGRFQAALAQWLEREQKGVASYEDSARAYLPFRRGPQQ